MKRLIKLLTLAWAFLLIATMGAYAQSTVTVGSQVTDESGIVSGKAYILKTGADRYITDNGTNYDVPNTANSATEASVYYLISNGDGTWKIKNYYTGKFWGVPVYDTSLASVDEASAGAWSLIFSDGIAYPSAPDASSTPRGIDRTGGKVWGWSTGDNNNHKVYIYEFSEVLTTPENITTGWYRLKWIDINGDTNTNYADADVSGKYVRNYAQDATVDETPYPLYLDDAPTSLSDLAATFVHFDKDGSDSGRGVDGYLRSANGHYVTNTGAASLTASSKNYIIYRSSSTPNYSTTTSAYTGTRNSLVPRGKDDTPYIGQTATDKFPVAEYYRVDPSLLGMQPWTVIINGSSETVDNSQVTYSGSDAYGLTNVYNGGTFFLAAGVTPTSSEFSAPNYGSISPTISVDATNYVINVTYITKDALLTINNTNTNRGALTYDPTKNETYIWSSGKSGATAFDAMNVNHQWILYPTGTSEQYYLYNVGAQKFAMPSGVGQSSDNAWYLSENAVAVKLELQTDNTFKIKLAVDPVIGTNAAYMAVSNNYTGPIINYNDEGGNFTITKVGTVSGAIETQRDAAVAKLVNQQTALTSFPQTSGWYVLQIKSKNGAASYANRYLYQASSLYNSLYPLSFTGNIPTEPAITDPTFFTYINHTSWDVNTWQLPDGRYLVDNGSNKFPTLSTTAGNVIAGYSNGNYFKTSNNYYADPYNDGNSYYIGETTSMRTAYNVYSIDLSAAGLTPWKVTINNAGSSTQLTCTRSDVLGMTSVYNNGWFFLPTGTTPTSSDFTLDGMISCTVDDANYTITAVYDPSICLLADDVAVIQGNQTTGIGNTMQALLRVKATPFATMTPKAVSVTLTNYDQLDKVAVYVTTDDELHAESASPFKVKIGEAAVNGASMTITTSSATALTAGTTYYLWITGDVKSTATEWGTIDAAITNIAYTSTNGDNALDVTSIGNPDGVMRIYKQQTFLWTPSKAAGKYYRIPTMITTNDGGIVALADYRHDHPYDLGKNASNGAGAHVIDVVSRRSTDGGLTWQNEVVVAAGDGTNTASYGYGDPAIVKDANGTLHCFMAAGNTSYANGMQHMGYSNSTDGGATWSAVTDIFGSINKNGLNITSAFTTAGTGVTFSNGRMAFAMLGKVSGTTNIYPLYSDNNGATWTISPTVAYAGGDESKFEIMNDNSLLVSVRKGGYNGTANRAHNRTTGDASGTGIDSWGTSADWTDMNANGCNADILYYSRTTEGAQDVMFHTLTKSYGAAGVYRRDLRLYMSLDQGATWTEAFSLQPGSAAYSSMQKLPNGDLAIIFEDGTIGNRDQQDCYAINYVVISKELLEEKINELVEDEIAELAHEVKVVYGTTGEGTYGSWSGTTWTSNVTSGLAGVTLTLSDGSHDKYSTLNDRYNLAYHPAAANTDATLTLTAPSGYVITGYSVQTGVYNASCYTLTASNGTTVTPQNVNGSSSYTDLSVSGISSNSTAITVTTTDASKWLTFANFIVYVTKEDAPTTTSTLNLKNTATGNIVYSTSLPLGIALNNVIASSPQGNLSPLVTYGDVVYDFSTNTYTVPYTVQTSSVASPTWYYARLRGTKFMSYDPMAEVLSGYGHPVTNQMTTFGNEYLWAFEGDPYVGVKIYNNAVGTNRSLASATKANNEYLHFVENGTTTFIPSAYNGGLVFKLNDENLGYLNDVNGGIGRWNSTWGATDAGSTMTLTALTDAEELASYIPDALTNYVAQFFTGNVIGAVGDFSSQTVYDDINFLRQQVITMGSSVTVSYYKMLMTALHGALTPLTTGNYRLLNVSTGKYLGFNEAFHVRGYTDANGTNTNEGYPETGQTLSTIWHIDVDNEGTSSAPVITNSGYYLDAVTSLDGTSACNLVLSAYPVSYGLGVNGEGAVYSSGDNVSASGWSSLYTDAARWRLVPASQADITITGNPLSGKSYATLYVPFDCTIATENTTAYKLVAENVDDANSRAYLTQLATYGEVIPAGTGVVLINTDAATTLTFTPCDDNTATAPTDNVILGTYKKVLFDSDTERTRNNTYIFGRGGTSGLAGFYQPSGSVTKLNANRCYIIPAAGGSTVGFALFFDDSPVTGIGVAELVPNGVQMPIYDLQGRRVAQPQKGGVYIVNGKKVML